MDLVLNKNSFGRSFVYNKALKSVKEKTFGNYPSPPLIIESVKQGLEHGAKKGYEFEAEKFGFLSQTNEAKALMSIFFASNELKKNRFGEPPKQVQNVAVLGAGLMGAGIAQVSLQKAKCNVVLKDAFSTGLAKGEQQIYKNLSDEVKKKKMTSFDRDTLYSKLKPSLDYKELKDTDLIIEAVFENIDLKHKVIREVEEVISDKCVFASNTSALPIKDIASASKRPENVIGMHYFSPVEKMPLLEIITTDVTSKETASIAVAHGLKQGKTVIVVKDGPGFYTTRILTPMVSEAFALLQDGVEYERIESSLKKFGFPVGPLTLADEVGIDVGEHIAHYLGGVFKSRMGVDDGRAITEMVKRGFLGRKSGKGFFIYEQSKSGKKGKSDKQFNPEIKNILKQFGAKEKSTLSDDDIQFRMVSRFINEAVYCLEDQILSNPTDGDIGAIFGLGYPPFQGGPFRFIDTYGAQKFAQKLTKYTELYGTQFQPANLLLEHAKNGTKFHPK